jgi:hypothetical protein
MQMVENEGIAKQISDLMVEFGGRLDGSVALVKDNCGEAELKEYRRAVGAIMAEMLFRVMNPLLRTTSQFEAGRPPVISVDQCWP